MITFDRRIRLDQAISAGSPRMMTVVARSDGSSRARVSSVLVQRALSALGRWEQRLVPYRVQLVASGLEPTAC